MDKLPYSEGIVDSDRIIYTPSDFAKSSLLYLQETGTLKALAPHTSTRENLLSYLFFMVLDGSGTLEYDGEEYAVSAGDCVFIDCRKKYAHSTSEDLWRLKWVHFYGPNLTAIYNKYAERGGQIVFRPHNIGRFDEIADSIRRIAESKDYLKDMHIFEQLSALTARIMEESWHENPNASASVTAKKHNLQEIKDYIDLHYRERLTLDSLAEIFFINKYYLTRVFKAQFGISVNSCIINTRITHAKKLLRFSDMSVEQIGHACGIPDANYFSRVFKKVEGVTPGEFRRKW